MNQYKVLIIGSGFGGLCSAIRLIKANINDFLILERRPFMGGTWSQNTYPGAAVDVQSPLYSISSEPYDWSQMFATQEELKTYTNYVIDKNKLREKCIVNSNVNQIKWSADSANWLVTLTDGTVLRSQFVINASGPLSTPTIPNFKGQEKFSGACFHTNDWQHDFDYTDKNVAIIGSGASAAQVIPAITDKVKQLHVFQRTPHWVIHRPDRKFTLWQRKLLKYPFIQKTLRTLIYWALEYRVLGFKYSKTLLDLIAGSEAKRYIKQQVKDKSLQQKLTPDFTIGCKRVILSNTYYPALCRENVFLHDKSDGITQLNQAGIHTIKGEQIDLDLIVYATGYDATDGVISYPVIGKNNKVLQEYWHPFPRAYLGTSIPNFPNLFIVTGPNTGIGHTSAIFIIESQINYIINAIQQVDELDKQVVEVTEIAEQNYTDLIHQEMEKTVWKTGECNSWYQSKSGHVIAMFPGFSFTYKRWAKKFKINDHSFY
jgi:cation diffusion facilitator CzcD-associated flavoprotein CzcO